MSIKSFNERERAGWLRTGGYNVSFPHTEAGLEQDEEWFMVSDGKENRKIRLHDYEAIFEIPSLYEEVVYKRLKCQSPDVVCGMLAEELGKNRKNGGLRVMDFGAGNGIVGECVKETVDCETLVGIDIILEAREAAERDHPGIYDDYYVMDLNSMSTKEKEKLAKHKFNTLVTVAALGFDDIPTAAFINAFNLLENKGWVAFNIKEDFLSKQDDTGFKELIDNMTNESMELLNTKRYCHRLSINGAPLYYDAIVGRKICS